MNPEKQRITIAKACGWTLKPEKVRTDKTPIWHNPNGWPVGGFGTMYLPDFVNDLNAMHDAEKSLIEYQTRMTYRARLHACCYCETEGRETWYGVMIATAEQRAEAFLKTLGLWEDDASLPSAELSNRRSPEKA